MAENGRRGHPGHKRRVAVFIDGQNVTIGARYAFSRSDNDRARSKEAKGGSGRNTGNMHPLILGRALAGSDTLVEIRYATGIPDAEFDLDRAASQRRRHDLIQQTGVVVLERTLRYRAQWEVRDRDLPNPRGHIGDTRQARVKAYNRGQEKGIDVWLALDALVLCARADIDRVIIASADSDLDMVPEHLRMLPGQEHTEVCAAVVVKDGQTLRTNDAYDETIAIDSSIYEQAEDSFDYREPLDKGEVAKFLSRIGADKDGIRD